MLLEDVAKSATTRVALMSLSGAGKSTLAAKLSTHYNLHWITLENDVDILLKLPKEDWHRVKVYNLPDSATFPVAADSLMKLFSNGKAKFCHAHGVDDCKVCRKESPTAFSELNFRDLDPKADIVVIDSGSQLGHSILAHATKDHPVDYKPERDDWGALRKWTEFFSSQWQAARVNLVVLFHAVEVEMEDGRTKMVPSFGSKDMSSKIAKAFSHVVYLDIMNGIHKAYSASTYSNNVLTKSRTDFEIERLQQASLLPIFLGEIPSTMLLKEEPLKGDEKITKKDVSSSLEKLKARLTK